MSQYVSTATKTCHAAGAIAQWLLVKIAAGEISAAGLAEEPIGVIEEEAFAAGDRVPVRLLSAQGTIKCKAHDAITQGAVVYGRAAGLIDDNGATGAIRIGIAMQAATAANDIIEVLPC